MGGYKEHKVFDLLQRNSGIVKYIISIVIVTVITASLLAVIIKENINPSVYLCKENSEVDYKVFLKENSYFKDDYLEANNQYIASLIDVISADFNYSLDLAKKDLEFEYDYKILAEINVVDKNNHKSLFKDEDILKNVNNKKHQSNENLEIAENIKIDYNKYNDLIQGFVNLYDLDDYIANVTVNMYVCASDNEYNTTPAISLIIPLTTETIAIDIESNVILDNTTNVVTHNKENKAYVFSLVIALIILILLVIKFIVFLNDTKSEKNVYKMRLRRIMSNYGSYIQKLYNDFEVGDRQILEIKSFEDLLQIKETMRLPILMTEKASLNETYFFISTEDTLYVYELKTGSLKKRRKERINPDNR